MEYPLESQGKLVKMQLISLKWMYQDQQLTTLTENRILFVYLLLTLTKLLALSKMQGLMCIHSIKLHRTTILLDNLNRVEPILHILSVNFYPNGTPNY